MDCVKFAKVLSLAASDNEAESVRAMQIAKRMLEAAGLDFVDVANLVVAPAACAESEAMETLRDKLALLRRENRQLKGENRRLRSDSATPTQEDTQIARLAAEVRRLTATSDYLSGELERSEYERYRIAAEARKVPLVKAASPIPRRSCRSSEGQYKLF
ncbi:hypothetical protein MCP1_640004 [Candidatus Terasakiella magnetica]|nr:hypothetical protein MCP1_640004 [Candidatus Terasakiella magnetica]